MKIYTKTGDDGSTGLFGGERVSKSSARIEAYGDVDELNCVIGVCRAQPGIADDIDTTLLRIQSELFTLGADLATPVHKERKNISIPRVTDEMVRCLEGEIDTYEQELAPLKNFILPSGDLATTNLHLARAVTRRAERRTAALLPESPDDLRFPLIYLNRLSDLLFILARLSSHRNGGEESHWIPNGERVTEGQ